MKSIIILILSFLLFSYSISAEEKNGAITEQVKESEIKVLEKQINIQKKALSEPSSKSGQNNEWFIVGAAVVGTLLGAALGACLSFLFTRISARDRRKEEQIEKEKIITDSIIEGCLKFIYKTGQIIDNLIYKKKSLEDAVKKASSFGDMLSLIDNSSGEKKERLIRDNKELLDAQRENPSIANNAIIMNANFGKELEEIRKEGFMIDFQYHKFQIQRQNNQKIKQLFEMMHKVLNKLLAKFSEDDSFDEAKVLRTEWTELKMRFVSYCLYITKLNLEAREKEQ